MRSFFWFHCSTSGLPQSVTPPPMNRPSSDSEGSRFQGGVRHYHRYGNSGGKSWDEWVDGKQGVRYPRRNVLRIVGVVLAVGGLLAVIIGLIVELG